MSKPVIKWSGSKRSQAKEITSYFPDNYETYYEPFVGGGSVLYELNPNKSICGDICEPLINLWKEIRDNPSKVAIEYETRWNRMKEEGQKVYYEIRDEFNKTGSPYDFLFLSRTCANGLIRFNSEGKFNNAVHFNRDGIIPQTLDAIIKDWSSRIKNTEFLCADYEVTTETAKEGDVIYLDPPYFHTKGMYFGTIDYDKFLMYLEDLNHRGIKYILSYDGKRDTDNLTVELPKELYKRHKYLKSGNSSFNRLFANRNVQVYESLYLNF